jgi:hypothetical protein
MQKIVVDDWKSLEGLPVEFHDCFGLFDRGTVGEVTANGEILWLKQEGVLTRRIMEKTTGTYALLEHADSPAVALGGFDSVDGAAVRPDRRGLGTEGRCPDDVET